MAFAEIYRAQVEFLIPLSHVATEDSYGTRFHPHRVERLRNFVIAHTDGASPSSSLYGSWRRHINGDRR